MGLLLYNAKTTGPVTVGALRFDAHADYLRPSTIPASGGLWSVCCWAKIVTDRNDYSCPVALEATGTGDFIELITDFDGTSMSVYDSSGADALISMTVGVWYFLALTVNGSSFSAYYAVEGDSAISRLDGTLSSTASFDRMWFGSTAYSEYWNGDLCQFRVWDDALTESEISAEFISHTLVRTSNNIGWWKLEANATRTSDSSGNGNTLTESGSGAWTEVTGPAIGPV